MATGSSGTVRELLQDLGAHRDLLARLHAQEALVQRGTQIVPLLLEAQTYDIISEESARGVLSGVLRDAAVEPRREVRALLEEGVLTFGKENNEAPRRLAWYGLVTHFSAESCESEEPGKRVLQLAKDRRASTALRLDALRSLHRMKLAPMDRNALVALLRNQDEEQLFEAIFDHMDGHAADMNEVAAEEALLALLHHASLEVRCRAIALLGSFGDSDAVARVMATCVDAAEQPELRQAIHDLVDRLIDRPRRLGRVSPDHFEHLVMHTLAQLGFEGAQVTRYVKDGGIDGTAHRHERRPGAEEHCVNYVIQCKRYKAPVGPGAVTEFVGAISAHQGATNAEVRGMLITTSEFSRAAREEAAKHYGRIELVDGRKLAANLRTCFGDGKYRV